MGGGPGGQVSKQRRHWHVLRQAKQAMLGLQGTTEMQLACPRRLATPSLWHNLEVLLFTTPAMQRAGRDRPTASSRDGPCSPPGLPTSSRPTSAVTVMWWPTGRPSLWPCERAGGGKHCGYPQVLVRCFTLQASWGWLQRLWPGGGLSGLCELGAPMQTQLPE